MTDKKSGGTAVRKREALQAEKRVQDLEYVRAREKGADRRRGEVMLTRSWIAKKLLNDEPDLQGMTYVEYGYMTPLERTELFTKEYIKAYRAAYAKHHPGEDASKKQPIDPTFCANTPAVMTALWRARAIADREGVPYDMFMQVVMESHLVRDKWQRPPRPNQLYGKLVGPRLQDLHDAPELDERLFGPNWDGRFFAAQYRGDEVQERALNRLARAIKRSSNPAETLAKYLCDRKAITVERAVAMFGQDLVDAARQSSAEAPIQMSANTTRYVPPCFGYPEVDDVSACQTCTINRLCLTFDGMVRDDMIRTFGTDDPRREWKKQVNRERQRRHRRKQQEEDWTTLID